MHSAASDDFGDFQAVPTTVSSTNGQMDMFATFPPAQQPQQPQQTNYSTQQPAFGDFSNFNNSTPFAGTSGVQVGNNDQTMDLFGSPPKSAPAIPSQPSYHVNGSGNANNNDAWAHFPKPALLPSVHTGNVPNSSGFSTAAAAGKSEIWSNNINLVSLDSLGQRVPDTEKV